MSMGDVFGSSRMKDAIDELSKSEEGRNLAEKLRTKLKELNEQFKGLSGNEKAKFLSEFREKFSDSLGDLKDSLNLKVGENVDGEFKMKEDANDAFRHTTEHNMLQPNYKLFLLAIVIVLFLFG